jgi:hypothetical protein
LFKFNLFTLFPIINNFELLLLLILNNKKLLINKKKFFLLINCPIKTKLGALLSNFLLARNILLLKEYKPWVFCIEYNPNFPNDGKLHFRNRAANATFKKCVPLLDSLSSGYIIPLWADVMVEQENKFPEVYWKTHQDIFSLHVEPSREIPAPVDRKSVV